MNTKKDQTESVGHLRPRRTERLLSDAASILPQVELLPELLVSGATLDSRRVQAGDIYAALPGEYVHGAEFVDQAAAKGAVVILTDQAGAQLITSPQLPIIVVDDPRSVLGPLSAWVYGSPSQHLAVVAVTGTDGKTTTSMLLEAALRGARVSTGLIGTVSTRIGDQDLPSVRTTPEAPDLQALLAVMLERGVEVVVMEVSSHALVLGRVDGLLFDLAIFTNLGHDHLDFHGTQESYFEAKASLFSPTRARRALVCIDDQWGERLSKQLRIPAQTYSVSAPTTDPLNQAKKTVRGSADWTAAELTAAGASWTYRLRGPGVDIASRLLMPGIFNVRNAVAAAAAGIALGADVAGLVVGIGEFGGAPGRMESITTSRNFVVIVDYAHTPDAVERALTVGREIAARTSGRLLVALGCGGDRDRVKRPIMGALAAGMADVVVVTDDNPRSEDAGKIRDEILGGAIPVAADTDVELIEIGDRRAALVDLIAMARAGDVIMALGRGHESGQEIAGVVYPLDDRLILRNAISERTEGGST